MEINITKFFKETKPSWYSASVMEIGTDAGPITWLHAKNDSRHYPLLDTEEKREAFRAFVRGFGAWDDEEIAAWSDVELNALCIQFIAGEMREFQELANGDWSEWRELGEAGTVNGLLFGGELSTDGEIYFYIGD